MDNSEQLDPALQKANEQVMEILEENLEFWRDQPQTEQRNITAAGTFMPEGDFEAKAVNAFLREETGSSGAPTILQNDDGAFVASVIIDENGDGTLNERGEANFGEGNLVIRMALRDGARTVTINGKDIQVGEDFTSMQQLLLIKISGALKDSEIDEAEALGIQSVANRVLKASGQEIG